MRRIFCLYLIAAAPLAPIDSAFASPPRYPAAQVAPTVVTEDRYPALRATFPNGVVGLPDLVYANRPGYQPLKLDLYSPRGASTGRALPLVVYVHGGAWRSGHSRAAGALADFPRVLASLAARGFVVASVNYRLVEEARYPAAVDDLRAALNYLRSNAQRFGINPNRVILWGASAGSQLAALVATQCLRESQSAARVDETTAYCVQGVVSWYGIFDLATLERRDQAAASPTTAYLGCNPYECPSLAVAASPVTHIDSSDPPFLLLHGLADRIVVSGQSLAMETRLREAGVPVQTEYFTGAGHSWIGATPEATRRNTLAALARTFRFIEELMHARY